MAERGVWVRWPNICQWYSSSGNIRGERILVDHESDHHYSQILGWILARGARALNLVPCQNLVCAQNKKEDQRQHSRWLASIGGHGIPSLINICLIDFLWGFDQFDGYDWLIPRWIIGVILLERTLQPPRKSSEYCSHGRRPRSYSWQSSIIWFLKTDLEFSGVIIEWTCISNEIRTRFIPWNWVNKGWIISAPTSVRARIRSWMLRAGWNDERATSMTKMALWLYEGFG